MPVIINNQTKTRIPERKITQVINKKLIKLGYPHATISISIIGPLFIKELNTKYRGAKKTTDVLSFPIHINPPATKKSILLGDIVINETEIDKTHSLDFLISHGLLHLVGYDHGKNQIKWNTILKRISQ